MDAEGILNFCDGEIYKLKSPTRLHGVTVTNPNLVSTKLSGFYHDNASDTALLLNGILLLLAFCTWRICMMKLLTLAVLFFTLDRCGRKVYCKFFRPGV